MSEITDKKGQSPSEPPAPEPERALVRAFSQLQLAPVPKSMARNLKRAAIAAPFIAAGFGLLYAGLEYLSRPPNPFRDDEDDEP